MSAHVEKARQSARQPAAQDRAQRQGQDDVIRPVADHRSQSIAQGKWQGMANVGPQSERAERMQRMADVYSASHRQAVQKKENRTGLPDALKSGIENLSGYSMDHVKVHYNSDKPSHMQAHAYAQGNDIHLAPGQEKHLPHEAWHVVQQAQGRVRPTMQMKGGIPVNGDRSLEHEADVMGAKALQSSSLPSGEMVHVHESLPGNVVQRVIGNHAKIGDIVVSMSGAQWIITKVEGDEKSGYRYTVEQISGKPVMWNPRTVSADDPAWNLVQGEPDLSDGYSDSEDIDSPSEGESVDLHRTTTGETVRTRRQTPRSAELRSARHIRDMRANRPPRHSGSFLTSFGESHFEFSPTPVRKDFGVTPVVPSEEGGYARSGSARQYPAVARDLDEDVKRTGATEEQFNKCLEHILRVHSDASLQELQESFCKTLDEASLEHLREMAAILRLDQARSRNSRGVIDEEVFGGETSFKHRFGAPGSKTSPDYRGARSSSRHGGLGGVQSLRQSDSSKYASKKAQGKGRNEFVVVWVGRHLSDQRPERWCSTPPHQPGFGKKPAVGGSTGGGTQGRRRPDHRGSEASIFEVDSVAERKRLRASPWWMMQAFGASFIRLHR